MDQRRSPNIQIRNHFRLISQLAKLLANNLMGINWRSDHQSIQTRLRTIGSLASSATNTTLVSNREGMHEPFACTK